MVDQSQIKKISVYQQINDSSLKIVDQILLPQFPDLDREYLLAIIKKIKKLGFIDEHTKDGINIRNEGIINNRKQYYQSVRNMIKSNERDLLSKYYRKFKTFNHQYLLFRASFYGQDYLQTHTNKEPNVNSEKNSAKLGAQLDRFQHNTSKTGKQKIH